MGEVHTFDLLNDMNKKQVQFKVQYIASITTGTYDKKHKKADEFQ